MNFLKRLRLKVKGKSKRAPAQEASAPIPDHRTAKDYTKLLTPDILHRIFAEVCPHALDSSLTASEESIPVSDCMLCDLRDLGHCALVCRRWHDVAQRLLYQNVRIDAVHYCDLEVELAAKRKKTSWLNHNAEPIDAPRSRFLLFMRSVRESNNNIGDLVLSLRMPYMTREISKSDLARTVAVLPNLRYADLPTGVFTDDVSSHTLKVELMSRCPDIRRMKYAHGSEGSFSALLRKQPWANIEVLELSKLEIESQLLRRVLGCFLKLQDLKLEGLRRLDNTVFEQTPSSPSFPPLQRLTLEDSPKLTAEGLTTYLSSQNNLALQHLSLLNTGVLPETLQGILAHAPSLGTLSIIHEVTKPFPSTGIHPLSSQSLTLLHYEITSESSTYSVEPISSSYYTYLMSSLQSGNLPALKALYVRDAQFSETLMATPPQRDESSSVGASAGSQSKVGNKKGFNQVLAVYSKGADELEWNFTTFEAPPESPRRASIVRPLSCHGAQLGPSWGGNARESVFIANEKHGFLAVPSDQPVKNSNRWSRANPQQDLWR